MNISAKGWGLTSSQGEEKNVAGFSGFEGKSR
jgi:hypothetical protein